jgi:hypothetical protein
VIGPEGEITAQGPGDDVAPRVGARLLASERACLDEFLNLRVIDGHLIEAPAGQAVDA